VVLAGLNAPGATIVIERWRRATIGAIAAAFRPPSM